MKKIIAWLLVLALTAAISIGATLAYLTDTDEDVNVMTVGKVKIDQLEYERVNDETKDADALVQEFHDNKPLYPGVYETGYDFGIGEAGVDWTQIGKDNYSTGIWNPEKINNELDKMVFVKNKGNYDSYVRTVFAFEAGNYETLDAFLAQMHLNLNETDWSWEWIEEPVAIPNEKGGETSTKYFIAVATYNEKLAPGAITEISLSQIALDKSATNADVEAFGDTYQILVKTQAIQADGFESAAIALDEGFEPIDETSVPWETDLATKGGAVYNALHYLNGDATGTQITSKIKTITFGTTQKYESIAAENKGILIDMEQDIPVYAYYVENGSNYDIYLLANDDIYLPKDCNSLMRDMTALTAVNTENLNTSRVENMYRMFRGCSALNTLDTTGWDTSKVTDMRQMFYQTGALKSSPGIEDWDTAGVTSMSAMFRQAGIAGELDLSGWDVTKVTSMAQMFYKVANLVSLNAEGWDAGNVTDMSYFITQSGNLQYVNAAGWDTSSVTNMYAMFYECTAMKSLNVTGWDTSNVTDASVMFVRCRAMTEMIGSGGLNFGKVTNMASMCEGWDSMTTLDVTNWNCGSATNMTQMFAWALKMENFIGIENWDVSNVETFSGTFRFCYRLKDLNVSTWKPTSAKAFNSMFSDCTDLNLAHDALKNWDLPSVEKLNHMFYGASNITGLDLSGWDLPNLITVTHMFADCTNLKFVDFSGWNTPSLVSLDCVFNDCVNLEWVHMGDIDTHNVTEFSQLFERCPSLHTIIGIENWDTSKSGTFVEMFLDCKSLKVLDLSSFDTRAAYDNYYDTNNSYSNAFNPMFSNMNSLEKLILSDKISYYGNGNVSEGNKLVCPNPAAKEGYTAMWRNVETGELFLGKDIPELTAATYEAYYEPISTT